MSPIKGLRTGGRSARVQESVHAAVRRLLADGDRSTLTVPMVAACAGVTPSTIYRRWGDLADLLADVAVERMRGDGELPDTGTLGGDLQAWAEQYFEEMASEPGRALLRDVVASSTGECPLQCCLYTREQMETIAARAAQRAEAVPEVDRLMDHLVAPMVYRLLFLGASAVDVPAYVRGLVRVCLAGMPATGMPATGTPAAGTPAAAS